jgi:superfamily II DNA or RNA helicase
VITLRPYQQAAVAAVVRGFEEYDRQLAVMPTAAGKTIVFAKLAQHTQPGRTLVVAHREELLEQAKDKILAATGIVAEVEAAERVASLDASVVVASVQTLMRDARRQRWP